MNKSKNQHSAPAPPSFIPNIAIALGLACIVMAASGGYSPFPHFLNEITALPILQSWLNPSLYSQDLFIQNASLPPPLWIGIYTLLDLCSALPQGLFIIALLIPFTLILAMTAILRALGTQGLLLPLAVIIGLCGQVQGLGHGAYFTLSGEHAHPQSLALLFLFLAYLAFIKNAGKAIALCLGLTLLSSPPIGLQGLLIFTLATLFLKNTTIKKAVLTISAASLIGAPALLPFLSNLLTDSPHDAARQLLFRFPHFYEITPLQLGLFAIIIIAGWTAILLLLRKENTPAYKYLAAIIAAQSVILIPTIVLFGPWSDIQTHATYPLWLFQIIPLYSTPLLLLCSSLAITAAIETHLQDGLKALKNNAASIISLSLWAALTIEIISILYIQPNASTLLIVTILTAFTMIAHHSPRKYSAIMALIWLIAGGIILMQTSAPLQLEATLETDKQELYHWAKTQTPTQALFIVPPSADDFRYHTQRSLYVDFNLFPLTNPALIPQWKSRLEEISAPDKHALWQNGWPVMFQQDRTYSARNTPTRILHILENSKADYFIWEKTGLDIPPFIKRETTRPPALKTRFKNKRYTVFQRESSAHE